MFANRALLLCLALGVAAPALACEPPAVFYDRLPASTDADTGALNAFVTANAPRVTAVNIGRGTAAESSLCGGQGYVSVELAMPANAPYDFTQVGFEFRVAQGSFPEIAFPRGAIISVVEPETTFTLLGSWFEGPPHKQKPIEAMMEVFFVSPDGTTGPATQFPLVSIPETPAQSDKGEGATR